MNLKVFLDQVHVTPSLSCLAEEGLSLVMVVRGQQGECIAEIAFHLAIDASVALHKS